MKTGVIGNSRWVSQCSSFPLLNTKKQKRCLALCHQDKKTKTIYLVAFKALRREISYFFPAQNTHNVFTDSVASSPETDLQLVFASTKGFHCQSAGADSFKPSRMRQEWAQRTQRRTMYFRCWGDTKGSLESRAPLQEWPGFLSLLIIIGHMCAETQDVRTKLLTLLGKKVGGDDHVDFVATALLKTI